jgi:hypothetical protein
LEECFLCGRCRMKRSYPISSSHGKLDVFAIRRVLCLAVFLDTTLSTVEHWDEPLTVPVHTMTRVLKLL